MTDPTQTLPGASATPPAPPTAAGSRPQDAPTPAGGSAAASAPSVAADAQPPGARSADAGSAGFWPPDAQSPAAGSAGGGKGGGSGKRRARKARSAWQALSQPPWRFLFSAWPWRSFAYLASGSVLGLAVVIVLFTVVMTGAVLSLFVVGLGVLALVPLAGLAVAPIERKRLRLVDTAPISNPHVPPSRPGPWAWLTHRYRESATWRELAATLLVAVLGLADMLGLLLGVTMIGVMIGAPIIVAVDDSTQSAISIGPDWKIDSVPEALALVPIGLVLLVLFAFLVTAWAAGRGQLTRLLIAGKDGEPGERVVALTRSRARIVDAFQAERRRIERDLHDGAQQRLVALSVELGLARLDLPPESDAARRVGNAHQQAKMALAELRELIRGIHPQVLTDRGIGPAIADVAGRTSLPVKVDVTLPRLAPEVEAAAYFVVTEALANVERHSKAAGAEVRGAVADGRLVVEVIDDGVGGADPALGSGLVGLADRVAVVDGVLTLVSPIGGPTLLRVEIPVR